MLLAAAVAAADITQAQLADRQQELQLLMDRLAAQQQQTAVMVAGAADDGTALSVDHRHAAAAGGGDGGTANTIRTASPWSDQHHHHRQHSPSSMSPRPLSRSQQQQRSGVLSSSINSAIAAAAGSGVFSLGDVVVLRRELAQAEQLLTGYQAENAAAARRIKVSSNTMMQPPKDWRQQVTPWFKPALCPCMSMCRVCQSCCS